MANVLEWVATHKAECIAILTGAIALASAIVKVTPTPKDDNALAKLLKFLSIIGLNPSK